MTLNERVTILENALNTALAKIKDLSVNTEQKYRTPVTIVGGGQPQGNTCPIDIRSGLGSIKGGPVLWNDTEINAPYGTQPPIPEIGYNKHAHSRFSGGALIKDVIEIVEYEWGAISNKHSQGFLKPVNQPKIKKELNTKGEHVEKIGLLNLVFNPDTLSWGCPAYEIDVKKCFLVERDDNGNIALDENGNGKKSPIYNEDQTKSGVVWDKNAQVFRFYACYAPGEA